MNYLPSENVRVYPCANRGSNYNIEAQLNTEFNITTIGSMFRPNASSKDHNGAILNVTAVDDSTKNITLNIAGYYFELTNVTLDATNTTYAGIKLIDKSLTEAEKTLVLGNISTNSVSVLDDSNLDSTFKGLVLTTDVSDLNDLTYYIELGTANSIKPTIKFSGTDIELGLSSLKINTDKITYNTDSNTILENTDLVINNAKTNINSTEQVVIDTKALKIASSSTKTTTNVLISNDATIGYQELDYFLIHDLKQSGTAYIDYSPIGNIVYTLDQTNKTASLKTVPTTATEFTVPKQVRFKNDIYTVTTILASAFNNCANLLKAEIPNTVTTIETAAFTACSELQEMILPFVGNTAPTPTSTASTNTLFGVIFESATYNQPDVTGQIYTWLAATSYYKIPTTLKKVTLTSCITLHYGAFYNCAMIEEIILPNTLTTIETAAFSGCTALTTINIPNTVTTLNSWFVNCNNLKNITIPSLKTKTLSNLGISEEAKLDLVNISGGDEICSKAFYYYQYLKNVIISNSVATINLNAFDGCTALQHVQINNLKNKVTCTRSTVEATNTTFNSVACWLDCYPKAIKADTIKIGNSYYKLTFQNDTLAFTLA